MFLLPVTTLVGYGNILFHLQLRCHGLFIISNKSFKKIWRFSKIFLHIQSKILLVIRHQSEILKYEIQTFSLSFSENIAKESKSTKLYSCIIRVWSLFCSTRVYANLHFLPILQENQCLSFCAFCVLCLFCVELNVIFIICNTYIIIVYTSVR